MVLRAVVLGLAVPALLSASSPPEPTAVVEAFHDALRAGDRDRVLALLIPEATVFEAGGGEMSRAEYASHHLGSDMELAAATERRVTWVGAERVGDVAWVLSRSETRGSLREREVALAGVETMLLILEEGVWRIAHVHWSSRRLAP